jgi:hypothetical protein
MRSITKLFAAAAVILGLLLPVTACQNVPPAVTSLESILTGPVGQSLVTNLLTGIIPTLDNTLAKGAAGISPADLQLVVYWSNWLEVAVDTFGPFVPNFTAVDIAAVNQIITDLQADAGSTTVNTAAVVQDIATLVKDLQPLVTAVSTASPASVPAPVAPAS